MKKIISLTLIGLILSLALNNGCTKPGSTTILNLPDVAGFAIDAISSFVPGSGANVTLSVPNLGSGTFTINYSITSISTPADNMSGLTASITASGGSASFTTAAIPEGGDVSIKINSISNSSGSSTISSNNTRSFFDSTGLMTCTINGVNFRATDVKASLAGSGGILSIHGVLWNPLTAITLYWDNYTTGTLGTIYYNSNDFTLGSPTSTFNGSAAYTAPGIADLSEHGSLTITSYSPVLTGTFSFVNQDSTAMMSGTFRCAHP